MSAFTIDTSAVERLQRSLAGAEPIIRQEMVAGMQRVALTVEGSAKRFAPVQTGHLRRSITHNVTALGANIIARIGTNVPYAIYVEEGRGPIVARPGRWLRFTIGGVVIYTKRVGPAKGQHFMKRAIAVNRAAVVREFGTNVPQRITRRVLGP
jgi:Bacteriophage HK97-gp10, putative tail-component